MDTMKIVLALDNYSIYAYDNYYLCVPNNASKFYHMFISFSTFDLKTLDKETLYKCYYSYYNLKNMFLIIIGDVDVEDIIEKADEIVSKYYTNRKTDIIKRN